MTDRTFENGLMEDITSILQEPKDQYRIGFLVGTNDDSKTIVSGIIVPKQDVGPAYANFHMDEVDKAIQTAKESNQTLLGTVFYHGQFPAFESANEQELRNKLTDSGIPPFSIVIDAKGAFNFYE